MNSGFTDTRMLLLQSAGELFAEYGFDNVTTRMIANRAGVTLSGIHYHFRNKENLYIEAFQYFDNNDENRTFGSVLRNNPDFSKNSLGFANAIHTTCKGFMSYLFDSSKPEWWKGIIIRELTTPSSASPLIVKEIFAKEYDNDFTCFRLIKPHASDDEFLIWYCMLFSQGIFYLFTRQTISIINRKVLNIQFLKRLTNNIARSMIAACNLPMPLHLK